MLYLIKTATPLVAALALLCAGTFAAPGSTFVHAENPVVVMETSMGTITIELFMDKAPKTVQNFLAYVKSGFYDGTIIHRVVKDFVIQGGGYTPDLRARPTLPAIPNEATNGLRNTRGTLSMARYSDPNSATSQFFINTKDNSSLDHKSTKPAEFGYAVFAKVIDGMDVVDKIEAVPNANKGNFPNVPLEPVIVKSVKLKT